VETIEQEADRLNRFVADLLDLSRLNAGSLPLRIELNAVDDLIGVVIQQTLGIMNGRRLDVSLDGDAALLFARFDLVHSVRVLVNLIENATKYSPAGAPIVLRARRDGPWLALEVMDEGPGVAEAERERMFAPFYRPAGVPADSGSAGLGLSIARRLADAQHGRLTYQARPSGGSTFTLWLPAADIGEVTSESL
jgi:two-component system sensor histidine kinase KdpD